MNECPWICVDFRIRSINQFVDVLLIFFVLFFFTTSFHSPSTPLSFPLYDALCKTATTQNSVATDSLLMRWRDVLCVIWNACVRFSRQQISRLPIRSIPISYDYKLGHIDFCMLFVCWAVVGFTYYYSWSPIDRSVESCLLFVLQLLYFFFYHIPWVWAKCQGHHI